MLFVANEVAALTRSVEEKTVVAAPDGAVVIVGEIHLLDVRVVAVGVDDGPAGSLP